MPGSSSTAAESELKKEGTGRLSNAILFRRKIVDARTSDSESQIAIFFSFEIRASKNVSRQMRHVPRARGWFCYPWRQKIMSFERRSFTEHNAA